MIVLADIGRTLEERAAAFNFIADEECECAPEVQEAAVDALSDESPVLRAAAARALAHAAPAHARVFLPPAIRAEEGRFVAAVMRSALRAASLNMEPAQ